MDIIVLGSAAGGGFPQWNCACTNCRRARAGDAAAEPRTQSSLAVSADGKRWVLLNASPDLRQQCLANPQLHPNGAARGSPIAAVVLTNGDVDHVGGLLTLRERQPFALYASPEVRRVLDQNPIFNVLDRTLVNQHSLTLDRSTPISGGDGTALGLAVKPFAVPGKVPLHLEQAGRPLATEDGTTIGLEISDGRSRFFYIPGCAALTDRLAALVREAALVLFDGTLWRDDEMIANGTGAKTGKRMGHMSMSGGDGSIAAFAPLAVKRKVFVHINNTNPVLLSDSSERAAVEAAGWEVARDGLELHI